MSFFPQRSKLNVISTQKYQVKSHDAYFIIVRYLGLCDIIPSSFISLEFSSKQLYSAIRMENIIWESYWRTATWTADLKRIQILILVSPLFVNVAVKSQRMNQSFSQLNFTERSAGLPVTFLLSLIRGFVVQFNATSFPVILLIVYKGE